MRPLPSTSRRRERARLVRLLPALAVAAVVLSACASSSGAGWTYAPLPSTPAPSGSVGGASASPETSGGASASAGASAGASSSPTAGGSNPAASGGGAGPTLSLTAQNIAYDKQTLTVAANTAFTIAFNNQDSGVPHNVSIHKDSPTGQEIFKGDIITGPAQATYNVPALPAGTYGFVCSVHPNMTGTLTVQ